MRKNWALTINNFSNEDIETFQSIESLVNCYVYGIETSNTGTVHLQCFIQFKKDVPFSFVKTLFRRAHIEACVQSVELNVLYCKKGGAFHIYGIPHSEESIDKTQKSN